MISLVFSGDCEGCLAADLELSNLDLFGDKEWFVSCRHRFACERMKDKLAKAEEDVDV